jgi:voltage-gated potassium channel
MGEAGIMMQQLIARFMRQVFVHPPVMLRGCILLAAILLYGTTGFLYFELPGNPDLTWQDALWYCLVTLTTVGYGDFFPKTNAGRYLVGVPLLVLGIGLLGFMLSVVATTLITARNRELKGMSKVTFVKHVIVIHFPGVAKLLRLMDELRNDPAIGPDARFVLIDSRLEELPPELVARNMHYVRGDPTRDDTLTRANVDEAGHAIVLSRDPGNPDADPLNVTVTLAIEARTRHVNTVVECVDPASEELLRKAGCDRVVCLGRFEALYMSQELLNPGVQDIVADLLSTGDGQQFYLSPITLGGGGATFAQLREAAARADHIVLGIRRAGANHLNLPAGFALAAGDQAITVGAKRLAGLVVG